MKRDMKRIQLMQGNRGLSLIAALYFGVLLFLLLSGHARQLVVPRYVWMLGISALLLFLFALFPSSFRPSGLMIFFLTLLFLPGLFLSDSSALAKQRPVSIGRVGSGNSGSDNTGIGKSGSGGEALVSPSTGGLSDAAFINRSGKSSIPEEGTISLTGGNYFSFYEELYDNKERFIGRDIRVEGFLHTGTGLREDQVLLGRLLMWCCAADAYTVGFLLANPEELPIADPKEAQGRWFRLEGSITTAEYKNPSSGEEYTVPAIAIERAVEIEEPVDGYVYPDF